MDTFIHADIFFFITSVAVVFITLFMIVALYYFILILKRFNILSEKLEKNISHVSGDIEGMAQQVKESFIFNLIFPKRRKKKKE